MNAARMETGMAIRIAVVALVAAALGFGAAWWLREAGPESGGGSGSGRSEAGQSQAGGDREILYWVAPMDPNYRRDKPGKSPMGMDLVPVYADQADDQPSVPSIRIASAVINNIGVKTVTAERADLARGIEAVARVEPNEHRLGHVHVRTEGWIETLNVHAEGARVERGDVLFSFYAPALVSAQHEYLQALAQNRRAVIEASAERLVALGLSPQQIERLENDRQVRRLVDIKAPHDGYVMELNVRHGMFTTPSLMIMSIADLSTVWVDVDVFEHQAGWVAAGQLASMTVPGAPGRVWRGEVDYVYPTIRPESRTARARIVFDNPQLVLKPGMYAKVRIDAAPRTGVVVVPSQAVIRTGRQERVILALGEGRFRPAEVRTGLESGGKTVILQGLSAGERIVVSSQFLIDSEASMDASLMRMLGSDDGEMVQSARDMQGMDDSGHDAEEVDHSSHDMDRDAPTQALPREQGKDQDQMDHSGHDMSQAPTQDGAAASDEPADDQQHDHGNDDDQSTAHAPTQTLPRKRGRNESVEMASHLSLTAKIGSLPRLRGRAGVGAYSGGDDS